MRKLTTIACCAALFTLFALPAMAQEFSHEIHVIDSEMACADCHSTATRTATMPDRALCLDCHDEDEGVDATFGPAPDSHFGDYRHEHQFAVHMGTGDCTLCHRESEDCSRCHQGENVDFLSHDRNHRYLHGLDARMGTEDCFSCHASQDYCNSCHLAEGVKPANHFVEGFVAPGGHTSAAREDIQSCIMCHDGAEPPGKCALCH